MLKIQSLYSVGKEHREFRFPGMKLDARENLLVFPERLLLTLNDFLQGILFGRPGLWWVSGLMKARDPYEFSGWAWVGEKGGTLAIALVTGVAHLPIAGHPYIAHQHIQILANA